jgi:hypothetical protein
MPFALGRPNDRIRFGMKRWRLIAPLLLAAFASVASAQQISPAPSCAVGPTATYPMTPDTYPMTSNQYAVQYNLGGAAGWTDAQVYISYYGETEASPYRSDSGYTVGETSMSFVSIPAGANAAVALRVTLLSGPPAPAPVPFLTTDSVSVRPSVKGIDAALMGDGTVQISTTTAGNFAGEQFILWWNRNATTGGGIQGLVFFLNPIYEPPTGDVQVIHTSADLADISTQVDALDIEGTAGTPVTIEGTGGAAGIAGAGALEVPSNIDTIYLGPNAWVQGKLYFQPNGQTRTIYGPGVLDVSRFQYNLRSCGSASAYADEGDDALAVPTGDSLNKFDLEGIIISDTNHAANAPLFNSTVNNVKTISWNGLNAGLKLNDNTTASNVFVRSGDDSLMVWGSNISVTNATVWQNYNGGVVNLGWSNNSTGDNCLINGLYVVKTDWFIPTAPSFTMGPDFTLNGQNNAVIASLMVPGTMFGVSQPSLYENIYVEDPPQVLFSLKILPPDCDLTSFDGGCPTPVDLTQQSVVNLNIENLFTPPSVEDNSIGFETLTGYTNPVGPSLPASYTLTGSININLTNVIVKTPGGTTSPLTSANTAVVGNVVTNDGVGVTVDFNTLNYNFVPVTPCRIADTRNAAGPFGGPTLSSGSSRSFSIPSSACGIPSSAAAYALNVTVVPQGPLSWLTMWPTGQTEPVASTLNSPDGRIKANAAIVPAGTGGAISVFVTNTTDVILDINGYFVPTTTAGALAFYPVTPCRLVDTRSSPGPLAGPTMSAGQTRSFPLLGGSCNVPSTAQAYSLNFTAVPQGPLGWLTVWAAGQAEPVVSTLNAPTGTVTANAAIVPAGTAGAINAFVTNNTDLIIDINGYFAPPGTGGLSFYVLTPCRVLDTRESGSGQPFSGELDVNVTGSACSPPSAAQAYVFNTTVIPSGELQYLTVWPQGTTQPVVSTLNAFDGAITSNMAIVPTTNGSISDFATNPTQLILDLSGYFGP